VVDELQGLFTFLVGVAAVFLMPAGPCQTANWARGKRGWFTAREEEIMVNRVLRDDPSKGSMHNRQPVTPRLLWKSLKDFDLWYDRPNLTTTYQTTYDFRPLYILGLTFQIPMTPPNQYLTLSLRGLGFDTFQTNLLAIPWTVLHSTLRSIPSHDTTLTLP
jgi:hypothetical protein